MTRRVVSGDRFRRQVEKEVDQAIDEHTILHVHRETGRDFVVLGAEDWNSIQETLFLNDIPGMVESIHEAAREPLEEGTRLEDLDW